MPFAVQPDSIEYLLETCNLSGRPIYLKFNMKNEGMTEGCMLFQLIPTMPDQRLHPLMERFAQFIGAEKAFNGLFQVV